MDKHTKQNGQGSKSCSAAILFLRIFIGAVMLLHIIGKMQTYDNLVLEYNSFLGLSQSTSLALSMIVEGLLAAMIIIGIGTRFAALLMIAVSIVSIADMALTAGSEISALKLQVLYMGIYMTLAISGGGMFAYLRPEKWQ